MNRDDITMNRQKVNLNRQKVNFRSVFFTIFTVFNLVLFSGCSKNPMVTGIQQKHQQATLQKYQMTIERKHQQNI